MTSKPLRILVIDDNPVDRSLITRLLAGRDPAFEVETAETPDEALAICRQRERDCIILDNCLDEQSGIDLIPELKAVDRFCPILLLTGAGSERLAAKSIKFGASDYLTKADLSPDDLDLHIRQAVEAAARARETARREDEVARASRLDALGELSGGLAHDFNNILTTVQFAITLSLKSGATSTTREHLNNALDLLRRGALLTERLKSFAAHQPASASSRRVGDVLANFQTLVGPNLGNNVKLEVHAQDDDALVECDQSQLDHALVNLALNARDAIAEGGKGGHIRLNVTAAPAAPEGAARPLLEFQLSDDGPGMSREVHERATDPYFSTKERGPGTGLGLAMVYGFVQHSQGEFTIETELGVGTSVRMRLPVGEPRRVTRTATPDAPCRAEPDRRRTILIVDDEVLLLMEAAEVIRDFGYDVLEASSAEEALSLIDPKRPIDVLLTDVHMPRTNGFTLAKAARQKLNDLKVIYFSGYTGYSEAEMGGVVAPVIAKPCSPADLAARIEALFEEDDDAPTPQRPLPAPPPGALHPR